MTASARFLRAEARVFDSFALTPTECSLELVHPKIRIRAIKIQSGREPTLFLHGITLCGVHWTPLIAHLPRSRCFVIDMPGHGSSEEMDFTGINLRQWHTDMLVSVLDELSIDSAHVVGHSYGGMFALWLALDAPERVRSVVTIGAPAVAFGALPDLTFSLLAHERIGPLVLSMPAPLFIYRRILEMSLGRDAIRNAPAELIRATYIGTRRDGFARTVSTYLKEQLLGIYADPPRYVLRDEELAQIQKPVLVIWGNDDRRYQPVNDARLRVTRMPNARFEQVPGGHEPWLNDRAACAGLVSTFISLAAKDDES